MFIQETPEEWEARHKGHVTEETEPEYPYEDRAFTCYDCDEHAEWKRQVKINRGD